MSKSDKKLPNENNLVDSKFLPRSFYIPQKDSGKELRDTVESILSEKFMIFLSILTVPLILLPLFFRFSPSILYLLRMCGGTILFLFILEYSSKLYLARDRWEHFKSPWHLLDLLIILVPFIQYLLSLSINIQGSVSLLFRLLRLPRALMVGSRAVVREIQSSEIDRVEAVKGGNTIIRGVDADLQTVHENLTWEEVESHLSDTNQEWIDLYNMSYEDFDKLSKILRIPVTHFKSELVDEIYPHIDYIQRLSVVFLQSGEIKYPEHTGHYLTISRSGIIVICNGTKIITASKHGIDLFNRILNSTRNRIGTSSFLVAVLYGILENLLNEYRSIISEIEIDTIQIGSTPRSKLPRDFLERIYQLDKEVSRLVSNLVHFKDLLGIIMSKKVPLDGFDRNAEETFDVLQDDVSYLNEIADNLMNNIRYIIDLYINYSSFETNRILKILAVITSISVIPTAVGGLLGENLLNVPFPFYLWQVVFMTGIGMTLVTYVFIKLEWLKT